MPPPPLKKNPKKQLHGKCIKRTWIIYTGTPGALIRINTVFTFCLFKPSYHSKMVGLQSFSARYVHGAGWYHFLSVLPGFFHLSNNQTINWLKWCVNGMNLNHDSTMSHGQLRLVSKEKIVFRSQMFEFLVLLLHCGKVWVCYSVELTEPPFWFSLSLYWFWGCEETRTIISKITMGGSRAITFKNNGTR